MHFFELMRREVMRVTPYDVSGEVVAVNGLAISIAGISEHITIGERCFLQRQNCQPLSCEVISINTTTVTAMAFGSLEGIGIGNRVTITHSHAVIYPHTSWLGRTLNAFGDALDDEGALVVGDQSFPIQASPPPAHQRRRMGNKLAIGVRAIDCFTPCCKGQRMGIFAGSGVGKSILLSMIARNSLADVIVVGLIGERGREVREFIETALGEAGMKRCVIVVATSDEPALCRKQAAFTAITIAEYFRSVGQDVLLLLDSVTRFAMALREIGLSVGEPPTTKGYPPSVFTELPKLLERAGTGRMKPNDTGKYDGNITALFTILVEGDDHNEPISDAIRGILDGHLVLNRAIAQRGRYPALDILQSVSRALPTCNNQIENNILHIARENISLYDEMSDLISLGTYRKGTDAKTDTAIRLHDPLEKFLHQDPEEKSTIEEAYSQMAAILDMPYNPPSANPAMPKAPTQATQNRVENHLKQPKNYASDPQQPTKILNS